MKNDTDVRQYIDLVYTYGHTILNKVDSKHVTKINNTDGGTIIDHIVTDNITSSYTISLYDTPISDHRYILTTINKFKHDKTQEKITRKIIEYHKITPKDINTIQNSLNINDFIDNTIKTITKYTKTTTKSPMQKIKIYLPGLDKTL